MGFDRVNSSNLDKVTSGLYIYAHMYTVNISRTMQVFKCPYMAKIHARHSDKDIHFNQIIVVN